MVENAGGWWARCQGDHADEESPSRNVQENFANFEVTNIRTAEDLADVLLILATYTPAKE